jgi:hypothetical protein
LQNWLKTCATIIVPQPEKDIDGCQQTVVHSDLRVTSLRAALATKQVSPAHSAAGDPFQSGQSGQWLLVDVEKYGKVWKYIWRSIIE